MTNNFYITIATINNLWVICKPLSDFKYISCKTKYCVKLELQLSKQNKKIIKRER